MVGLVAAREIRMALRSRALRIGTALVTAVIVAAIVVPQLVEHEETTYRVGVVAGVAGERRQSIVAAGRLAGARVRVVALPDDAAAGQAIRSGRVDLAVAEGPVVLVEKPPEAGSGLGDLTTTVARLVALETRLEGAGLPAGAAAAALAAPPIPMRSLEAPDPDQEDRSGLAFVGGLALYMMLLTYGSWISQSVVEEKSSRVVEVLLAAVRPAQLLVGKVVGIGVVAMGQALVFGAAALGAAAAVGFDTLPSGTAAAAASAVLWFLLGFAFYSFVFATVGALASNQQDAQIGGIPVGAVLLVAYFGATGASSEPDYWLARLLSYFPPTAPVVMPARIAAGGVAPWEVALAVALMAAAVVVLVRLAGHIYPRVALHSGARLKLRQAWARPVG